MKNHGFKFIEAPADSPVVAAYFLKNLVDNGLPLDTHSSAEHWIAMVKPDAEGTDRVYGVFGWRQVEKVVEISDYYLHESRFGVLAGYAAMEYIKRASDETGTSIVTVTPITNSSVSQAYKKFFGVTMPTALVYRYDPPKIQSEEPAQLKEAV